MTITRHLMDMPVTVRVDDAQVKTADLEKIFDYFHWVDETFSPFKSTSEISLLNQGKITPETASAAVKEILQLCETTKQLTAGFFDAQHNKVFDPSGLVKGWAIWQAAQQLTQAGFQFFYLNVGGDIQTSLTTSEGKPWLVGIRHPIEKQKTVKTVRITGQGVATSGTYLRGQHIYNPRQNNRAATDWVSLTVIGPNIYEADRWATAAFAMGKVGLAVLNRLPHLAAYGINSENLATYTDNFSTYVN